MIVTLGLPAGEQRLAVTADGNSQPIDSYVATTLWFGERQELEIIVSPVSTPLLGLRLLPECRLVVDFAGGQLELTRKT